MNCGMLSQCAMTCHQRGEGERGQWVNERFSDTVNVDAVNCDGHGRADFRPRIDRVFTTRPGHLTRRDADVPVHVFLTLIFEFFSHFRAIACYLRACCDSNAVLMRNRTRWPSTLTMLLNLPNVRILRTYVHMHDCVQVFIFLIVVFLPVKEVFFILFFTHEAWSIP